MSAKFNAAIQKIEAALYNEAKRKPSQKTQPPQKTHSQTYSKHMLPEKPASKEYAKHMFAKIRQMLDLPDSKPKHNEPDKKPETHKQLDMFKPEPKKELGLKDAYEKHMKELEANEKKNKQ